MKIKYLIWIILIFPVVAISQTGYNLLELPIDNRSMAIASSNFSELPCNICSTHSLHTSISFSFIQYPEDIDFHSISFTKQNSLSIFRASVKIIDYAELVEEVEYGIDNISSAKDTRLSIEYNRILHSLFWVGGNISYLRSRIAEYSSQLVSSSIRLHAHTAQEKLGMELAVENFGFVVDPYWGSIENLPQFTRLSLNYKPLHLPAVLMVNIRKYTSDEIHISGGLELGSKTVKIRVSSSSYRKQQQTGDYESDFLAGLNAGIGIYIDTFMFDFGFRNLGAGGWASGITMGLKL